MASFARTFIGPGSEYISPAISHTGGKAQLIVFGSPGSGGSDCRVSLLKEVASPVSDYKELNYPIDDGVTLKIDLEACNLKIRVTEQSEYSNFTVELVTK